MTSHVALVLYLNQSKQKRLDYRGHVAVTGFVVELRPSCVVKF